MSEQHKAPPPAELSLKYLAWDVKEIAKSLKELVDLLKNKGDLPPTKSNNRQSSYQEDLF